MKILGLHHITLVSSDAQRTVDFYTGMLGLRLVKQTVNFDDPTSYHLYFGDDLGRPGTAITFFEWKGAARGYAGIGGTHHFALAVADYNALLKWKRWLTDGHIQVDGPFDRHYFKSIYFRDPDGTIVEIATQGPGWTVDESAESIGTEHRNPPTEMMVNNRDEARIKAESWPEPIVSITPEMALMQGMHHITAIASDIHRTDAFYSELLGMRRVKMTSNFDDPTSAHWYWGVDEGKPGTLMTYFERKATETRGTRFGAGQTHHVAFAVADEAEQAEWRVRLSKAGLRVSPIMDRVYFKSIYTNDPDGHIIELATIDPGFPLDESPTELGTHLMLPPWLDKDRKGIESLLTPLKVPAWTMMENA